MSRYKLWNYTDDIITPSGARFTADEWKSKFPWCTIQGARMVISGGFINGGCALELTQMKENAIRAGLVLDENLTDDEILEAIENFEDNPPAPDVDSTPTAEERTAAALEMIAMENAPDSEANSSDEAKTFSTSSSGGFFSRVATASATSSSTKESAAFKRVKSNVERGLWGLSAVYLAVKKGLITKSEYAEITGETYT